MTSTALDSLVSLARPSRDKQQRDQQKASDNCPSILVSNFDQIEYLSFAHDQVRRFIDIEAEHVSVWLQVRVELSSAMTLPTVVGPSRTAANSRRFSIATQPRWRASASTSTPCSTGLVGEAASVGSSNFMHCFRSLTHATLSR